MNESSATDPSEVIVEALEVAVPLWIGRLYHLPVEDRLQRIAAVDRAIVDLTVERPGMIRERFNALAEGLALLSFVPGGVSFLGRHWETV
jgi:hypothetical protein